MPFAVANEVFKRIEGRLGHIEKRLRRVEERPRTIEERNWQRRLAVLRGVYGARGHRGNGYKAARASKSVVKYDRDGCLLFAELLDYVTAAGKSTYRERYTWESFWPAMLDEPALMGVAGVEEPLKPRLINLGLITTEEAYPEARETPEEAP